MLYIVDRIDVVDDGLVVYVVLPDGTRAQWPVPCGGDVIDARGLAERLDQVVRDKAVRWARRSYLTQVVAGLSLPRQVEAADAPTGILEARMEATGRLSVSAGPRTARVLVRLTTRDLVIVPGKNGRADVVLGAEASGSVEVMPLSAEGVPGPPRLVTRDSVTGGAFDLEGVR